ncbi:hypothetical protein [Spirillospora sp. CA-128828]
MMYDHFPSKRVLLLAVMQEQNAALMRHSTAARLHTHPQTVRNRIRQQS